jgi:DNA polymerase
MSKQNTLDDSLELTGCEQCPKLCANRNRIVDGVGPLDARVVIVGEAPGATEDEQGEPFVGRSGDILDEALAEAGLSRSEVRITNCVRCRPPDNRDPHVGELANCLSYLDAELTAIDPAVVVPLGRIPVEQLLGDVGKVTDVAGSLYSQTETAWSGNVVASVHPAATLYNRSLRPVFDETFELVATHATAD